MNQRFFITGTDTGAGKTLLSCGLLCAARSRGLSTLGLKPVAAGSEMVRGVARNPDTVLLRRYSSLSLPWDEVNPVLLEPAVAPHIAALQQGIHLSAAAIAGEVLAAGLSRAADFVVVEGAGGWLVPLNDEETMADLAVALELPVILAVRLRLGCLNHALLAAAAIAASGLRLVAWAGLCCDYLAMPMLTENVESLRRRLSAPCIGVVPHLPVPANPEHAADSLILP